MTNKLIELIGVLDPTGEKKISLKYDDINDTLLIEDDGILKKVWSENDLTLLQQNYSDLETRLTKLGLIVDDIKILSENKILVRLNSHHRFPKMTKSEQTIHYYWICMRLDYGPLKPYGKMFKEWPQIPFHIIENKWNMIVEKYRKRGYNL